MASKGSNERRLWQAMSLGPKVETYAREEPLEKKKETFMASDEAALLSVFQPLRDSGRSLNLDVGPMDRSVQRVPGPTVAMKIKAFPPPKIRSPGKADQKIDWCLPVAASSQ